MRSGRGSNEVLPESAFLTHLSGKSAVFPTYERVQVPLLATTHVWRTPVPTDRKEDGLSSYPLERAAGMSVQKATASVIKSHPQGAVARLR